MSGRKQDSIWINYNRSLANNSKATVKYAGKQCKELVFLYKYITNK